MPARRTALVLLCSALLAGTAACSSEAGTTPITPGGSGDCPTAPIDVVVTVNQWGDIVDALGGACANTTTVISSSSVDPHDYEPTTGDSAVFTDAALVVENGLGYDAWADRIIETLSTAPAVVDAGEVAGKVEGDNPHLWYGPSYVYAVADAVTAELSVLAPDAAAYFKERNAAWRTSMKPYDEEIAAIKAADPGSTYAATESVFDYMAEAIGLRNLTPQGYQNAAANESDPAPGDIAAFQTALSDGSVDVLVYNTQTEGAIPEQIAGSATEAGVPVVDVTETVPEGSPSFVQWQVDQLQALSAALAGTA